MKLDQFTGYRYYSINQLSRLNRIVILKSLGLSLDEVREFLDNDLSVEYIRKLLRVKRSEIQQRLDIDTERLHQVEIWLEKLEGGGKNAN